MHVTSYQHQWGNEKKQTKVHIFFWQLSIARAIEASQFQQQYTAQQFILGLLLFAAVTSFSSFSFIYIRTFQHLNEVLIVK